MPRTTYKTRLETLLAGPMSAGDRRFASSLLDFYNRKNRLTPGRARFVAQLEDRYSAEALAARQGASEAIVARLDAVASEVATAGSDWEREFVSSLCEQAQIKELRFLRRLRVDSHLMQRLKLPLGLDAMSRLIRPMALLRVTALSSRQSIILLQAISIVSLARLLISLTLCPTSRHIVRWSRTSMLRRLSKQLTLMQSTRSVPLWPCAHRLPTPSSGLRMVCLAPSSRRTPRRLQAPLEALRSTLCCPLACPSR